MVINDAVTHLTAGSLAGAICITRSPCLMPEVATAFNPVIAPPRIGLFSTDIIAIAERASLALVRIILLRDPAPLESFMNETMRAGERGSDFSDDNSAVSWETGNTVLGTAYLTSAAQKQLVATREHDPTKVLAAAKAGFPLFAIVGSKEAMMDSQNFREAMRTIFTNVEVEEVAEGCHAPFLDAPDQVMSWIFAFARRV